MPSQKPQDTSPNSQVGGILSSASASASSLLSSITSPSASSVTGSLASSSNLPSTKLANPQYPSSGTSAYSSTPSESFLSSLSPSAPFPPLPSSTNKTQGFRSQQLSQPDCSEAEFASFTKQAPTQLYTPQPNYPIHQLNAYNHTQELALDGQSVVSLLSQPLTSAIYSPDPELHGINIAHPIIRSFATCGDPIEFLSTTDIYTKEVWGDALGVVQNAREEVSNDKKGKRKQDSGSTATERLRMIWGHLGGANV